MPCLHPESSDPAGDTHSPGPTPVGSPVSPPAPGPHTSLLLPISLLPPAEAPQTGGSHSPDRITHRHFTSLTSHINPGALTFPPPRPAPAAERLLCLCQGREMWSEVPNVFPNKRGEKGTPGRFPGSSVGNAGVPGMLSQERGTRIPPSVIRTGVGN